MNRTLSFVLVAIAAMLVLACGLDAQCCGEKKIAADAAPPDGAPQAAPGGTVTTGALVVLLRAGVPLTLIDARSSPPELIPGAKGLAEECLADSTEMARNVGAKDRLIVTYCAGPKCSASSKMAAKLRAAGYTNVIEYREGFEGWKSARASASCCGSCEKACGGATKSEVCPETGATGSSGSCPASRTGAGGAPACVIDTAGLKALLDAKVPVVVFDARSGKYDDGSRVPGAVALACEDCTSKPEALRTLLKSKDQLVVTYCAAAQCPLSATLAGKLRAAGYANVIEYRDGIASWKKAGLKTVSQKASCCGSCSEKSDGGASKSGGDAPKSGCGSSCGGK